MNNLKIATRQVLLIGALAALLLVIGLTGLSGISQSNAALKSVYEDRRLLRIASESSTISRSMAMHTC